MNQRAQRATFRRSWLLATTALALAPGVALANPHGGVVAAGSAVIAEAGREVTITQSTDRAILNWQSFDIGEGDRVRFAQPSAGSVTLNRVTGGGGASQIDGQLTANGNVFLINPNGVVFGAGSQVHVAGLIATTADMQDSRFMAGNYVFDMPGNADASIINDGSISIAEGGLAALVAPTVRNSGSITARLGKVHLGAGDMFTLDPFGDGLLNLQAGPSVTRLLLEHDGDIQADGGSVRLTTAAMGETVSSLINLSGVVQTNTVGEQEGSIYIYAEGSNAVQRNDALAKGLKEGFSTVLVSGTLDAMGTNGDEKGGIIQVLADHVALMAGTLIDASGNLAGGTVRVGGDTRGEGDTPTAKATIVQEGASILANSTDSGDGGKVTVWADDYTNYAGHIEAKGGPNGGDGGFVETSGKQVLDMHGSVDASTTWGKAGLWLLDPNNATINGSATSNPGYSTSWTAGGGGGNVLNTDIQNSLNGGTSVSIIASGDITVSNSVAKTAGGDATLTLQADGNITVNADITSNTGKLNLYLNSDHDANSDGYIDIGANLTSNGGNITMGGGSGAISAGSGYAWGNAGNASGVTIGLTNDATVNAGVGNIIINGHGYNNATGLGMNGVNITLAGMGGGLQTSSGNITVNGISGNGKLFDYGISITSTVNTVSGAISLTGTSGASASTNGYSANVGIIILSGTVSSTGTGGGLGAITLNGTGANGNSSNYGVEQNGTISVVDANINITGTGGDGASSNNYGIDNVGTTESTGAGTITMTGYGGHYVNGNATSTNNHGIFNNTGTISGAGTGSVTVIGYGGKGRSSNLGLQNIGTITTASGALDVQGYGGTNGTTSTYTNSFGLYNNGGTISSTCTSGCGAFNVIGTGAAAYSNAYGVYNNAGTISTVAANLTITGTGGNGTNVQNYGSYFSFNGSAANLTSTGSGTITINSIGKNSAVDFVNSGANTIGGGSATGAITLNQDTATWDTLVTNTSGVLTIAPRSAGTTIAVANTNQTLNLDTTFLGNISSRVSEIDVGSTANTGGLTASAYASWANNLKLITGAGVMTISGAQALGAYGLTMQTNSDLALSANVSGSGTLTILPSSVGTTMEIGGTTKTLNISATEEGKIVDGWSSIVFGRSDMTGTMTVDASTWTDPATFMTGSGVITAAGQTMNANALIFQTDGDLTLTSNFSGTGALTVKPSALGTGIGLAGGVGALGISSTELGYLGNGSWSGITIGRTDGTGAIVASIYASWSDPLTLSEGGSGSVTINGLQTNTGAVTINGPTTLNAGVTTTNSAVTFNDAVTVGADSTITAGSGTVTFGSTVNGANNLTATAGTFSFGGAIGGSTPLAAVSLISTNSIALPAITASTMFARSTGAAADLTLNGTLTGSAAGTNITLVSGRNFINSSGSATPLSTGAGRFLVYSTNPASDTLNSMTASFRRFTCVYGGSCPSFAGESGSGFLYSYTPTLTATPSAVSLSYGDAAPSLTAYAYGLTGYLGSDSGSDNITGSLNGTTTYTQGSNVGSYNIDYSAGSLASALGYSFTYANNATAITVGKRALTATMQDQSITYGTNTPTQSKSNTSHVIFANLYGTDTGADLDTVTFSYGGATAGSINNVGSYALSISAFSDGNYSLTIPGGVTSSTLTIGKKALTAVMQDQSITYGTNTPTQSATNASHVAFSGFVNSEDASVIDSTTFSYGGATPGSVNNVGSYTLSISAFSDGNYSLTIPGGVTSSTLTIGKKALTAVMQDQSITYGANTPTQSATNASHVAFSGFVNSEDASVIDSTTFSYGGATAGNVNNVGSYTLSISAFSDGNYSLTIPGGITSSTLTIGKKALTAVMQDQSITYGTNTPTQNATNASHVAFSGFVNAEDASVIDSTTFSYGGATAGSVNNVGSYTLSISAFSDNNYSLTIPGGVTSGTLTIGKKALTAVMQDQSITYGTNTPTQSATNASHVAFSGFVNSEDASVIDSTTFSYGGATAGSVNNVGSFTLSISAFSDGNYSLTIPGGVTSGTLTVTKATLTAVLQDQNLNAGDTTPTLVATNAAHVAWSGFQNSENASVLDSVTFEYGGATPGGTDNAGTYALSISAFSDGNYSLALPGGVTPGMLTIIAGSSGSGSSGSSSGGDIRYHLQGGELLSCIQPQSGSAVQRTSQASTACNPATAGKEAPAIEFRLSQGT